MKRLNTRVFTVVTAAVLKKVRPYVAERLGRKKKDFRIDTFAAGGAGGMNQNAVNSGVRITDLITGLAVDCREERDQPQNKKKAFYRLIDKLIVFYEKEEKQALIGEVKMAERAIKTYNEQRNQVKDHRTGLIYTLDEILAGKLDKMLEETKLALGEGK